MMNDGEVPGTITAGKLSFNMATSTSSSEAQPIEVTMAIVLSTMFFVLIGTHSVQSPVPLKSKDAPSNMNYAPVQLPDPRSEPSKYCYEVFCWYYTVVWICLFGGIVVSQCYEYFTAWSYIFVCGGLALPLVLQPIIYPQAWPVKLDNKLLRNPDVQRPFRSHSRGY